MDCGSLTSITIPESVTSIGSSAFSNCDNLEEGACYSCASLEEVIILGNIETINGSTFMYTKGLERVVLPNSLKSIENSAFYSSGLKEITIPNSVTTIDTTAFKECTNLTNIYFAAGDNPIPAGQPWGAPNGNLVVTKLTEQ